MEVVCELNDSESQSSATCSTIMLPPLATKRPIQPCWAAFARRSIRR